MPRPRSIIVIDEGFKKLSDRFYRYLLQLGYVAETCRMRQLYLNEFLSWLECHGHLEIKQIISAEILRYYDYLGERPNKQRDGILSPKTTFRQMKVVELLFTMLQEYGEVDINPMSGLQFNYPREEQERAILSQSEVNQLYEVCTSAWERTILSLGYGCGLRAGELEQVNIEDVRLREKLLIVPKGKGNKSRMVPMSLGVIKDLSDYYFIEREALTDCMNYQEKDQAFMLNKRGGRMRDYTYNKNLRLIINRTENKDIGDKEISMHNLRHSIATHLIEQGLPVDQVRQFLGHSELETTQLYTRVSKNQLQELIGD